MMMEKGARNFAFISRSGADKPDAAHLVKSLEEQGANVRVFRADASNASDVAKAVAEVSAERPIRGVVHAAMVLQDGVFGPSMTYEKFTAAITPKVKGAKALHDALQGHRLDFFTMTSSISATLGNPGQTNYSAANSYLDALAWHRNLQALPATSLVLPMILDVGVVAENDSMEALISRKGMYGIDEKEMLRAFETAMIQPIPKPGKATLPDAQIILGVEPPCLAPAVSSADPAAVYWYNDARFAHVRRGVEDASSKTSGSSKGSGSGDFTGLVAAAQSEGGVDAAINVICDHIMKKCSGILMVPVESFEADDASIASYGLDSMIGAELRNWLFREFGLDIAFQQLLAGTLTFKGLSRAVADTLGVTSS